VSKEGLQVILPLHPRTRKVIKSNEISIKLIKIIEPVSYLDMLVLEKNAQVIVTDSGSVQKEAFILGVPCITLRDETEWEETVKCGMNVLVGDNTEKIVDTILNFKFKCKVSRISYCDCLGDGKAAMRIVNLCTQISRRKDE